MIYSLTSDGEHLRTRRHNINMWRTHPDIVTQQSVPLNGLVHMEATPRRMLSLLCRTHAVQLITDIIVQIPVPAKLLPQRRQSRRRKTPFPCRQVLPLTLAFRAGRTFHAYDTFRARTPPLRESTWSILPDSGTRPARLPWVSWLHPNFPWYSYPETYIFQIPGIPSNELHTTTLSHKHYMSALFKNTSQTKSFHLSPQDTATSPAAVSRNDTRLPGNLNPPTVAHNTLNTDPRALWSITNRQHCPIVTHLIRYYWLSKYKYIWKWFD